MDIKFNQGYMDPLNYPSKIDIEIDVKSKYDLKVCANSITVTDSLGRSFLPDYYAVSLRDVEEMPIVIRKNDETRISALFLLSRKNEFVNLPAILKCFFVNPDGDTVRLNDIHIKPDVPPQGKSKSS